MSVKILNYPAASLNFLAPETGLYNAESLNLRIEKFRGLASAFGQRLICQPGDAAAVTIFPDLAIEAGPRILAHTRIRQVLTQRPLLSLRFLLASYEQSSPILESTVLKDPESLVALLSAIDSGLIVPNHPRKKYEDAILNGPFWALRYISSPCQTPDIKKSKAALAMRLNALVESESKHKGQSALVYLLLNPKIQPTQFKNILVTDPMSAYLSTRLFGVRGLSLSVSSIQNPCPRWATHIALWGAFDGGNLDERIENAICSDPAWAAEYLSHQEDKHNDWDWVASIYKSSEIKLEKEDDPTIGNTWLDLLCAMIGRISRKISGADPKITFQEYIRLVNEMDESSKST